MVLTRPIRTSALLILFFAVRGVSAPNELSRPLRYITCNIAQAWGFTGGGLLGNPSALPLLLGPNGSTELYREMFPFMVSGEQSVRKWVGRLSSHKESIESTLRRGSAYKEMIERTLESHGVPSEFYYLPLIESGYVGSATSGQGAAGMWQLAKATGRHYGLIVNSKVDQRRDPVKSTNAAARYLRDLYERFHSWELVLAAYNVGENRIERAMQRSGGGDFWSLLNGNKLPPETCQFVPKFVAAVIVGREQSTRAELPSEG